MGTRHLIAVYKDGKHRIAQYGQFDGYPSGQGKDILAFLHDNSKVHMLRDYRLKNCRFLSQSEIDKINLEKNPLEQRPQLSRNLGADILALAASVDSLALVDSIDFAADSLFCEWAYVIDFDTNSFEIYKGFNTTPATGRFADMLTDSKEYYPVTLLKTYQLDALPSFEEFITDCEPVDEEEEEIA
jgi:hypothetical protein